MLCYTSGTTGDPKGVLYSHRATVLHAMGAALPDAIRLHGVDVVCPVVPLFHATAWGLPYRGADVRREAGAAGPRLDGASLYELFEAEGVTFSRGVPTVWLGFLLICGRRADAADAEAGGVRRLGGAAAMVEAFAPLRHRHRKCWGMTETSPLGTTAALKAKHCALDRRRAVAVKDGQGRPLFGVEMQIVDDEGRAQPHDGKSIGDLLVRGPWVVSGYFADEAASAAAVGPDGWFDTGDIATLDPDGYMQITDRKKDVIKSGGEWISSIDLENAAVPMTMSPRPRSSRSPMSAGTSGRSWCNAAPGMPARARRGDRTPCPPVPQMDAARGSRLRRRDAAHRHRQDHENPAARAVLPTGCSRALT